MKRVMCVFVFLMLVGGALAMDDAIRVRTEPGNEVRLKVRLLDGGFAINDAGGIADEDGYWEYTFFSLNREDIKYHVRVLSGLTLLRDDMFEGFGISDSLLIDCLGSPCTIAVDDSVVDEVEDLSIVANDSVVEVSDGLPLVGDDANNTNDSVVDSVAEEVSVAEDDSNSDYLTGWSVFVNEDGSIKWVYSVGGGVVLLFLAVFIFMMFHRSKNRRVVLGDDEKELEDMETRVRETEAKIKSVKDEKERKAKIERAKAKLAKEEAELKELERSSDEKIEEKKEEVAEAEEVINDAED